MSDLEEDISLTQFRQATQAMRARESAARGEAPDISRSAEAGSESREPELTVTAPRIRIGTFAALDAMVEPEHSALWSTNRTKLPLAKLLVYIARSVTTGSRNGSFKPCMRTYAQLAETFEVDPKTIRRSIEKLQNLGWIESDKIVNRNGFDQTVFYVTLPPKVWGDSSDTSESPFAAINSSVYPKLSSYD